jgi:1-deoxy-D-xylulose-5-phosphate synthase
MINQLKDVTDSATFRQSTMSELKQCALRIRERIRLESEFSCKPVYSFLRAVELTVAIHSVFDTSNDSLVFDADSEAFTHKLLSKDIDVLPAKDHSEALKGSLPTDTNECKSSGSEYTGTALSSALGLAVARDLSGGSEHVIVVCGKASFTSGISLEALNNATSHTRRLIVILNDDAQSIDRLIGAPPIHLQELLIDPRYRYLHDRATDFIERVGGEAASRVARKAEESIKGLLAESVFFEEFGLDYYGPVEGTDLPRLVSVLKFLKSQTRPVLLHIVAKNKCPAKAKKPKKKQRLGQDDLQTPSCTSRLPVIHQTTESLALNMIASDNPKVIVIRASTKDLGELNYFANQYPGRYFDVGLAVQHAVVFACGIAVKGFRPVCAIDSSFLQRALDPILHDVALQNLPVTFLVGNSGLSSEVDRKDHGMFDISYLRCIPNMVVMVPKDENELADMIKTAVEYGGPCAIRYPQKLGSETRLRRQPRSLEIGKAEVLQHGTDVVIFGLGNLLSMAELLASLLTSDGFSVAVINARSVKPVDRNAVEHYGNLCSLIVSLEDHSRVSGFGSALLEVLSEGRISTRVIRIAWPDQFLESGNVEGLRNKYGVTIEAAMKAIRPFLRSPLTPLQKVH